MILDIGQLIPSISPRLQWKQRSLFMYTISWQSTITLLQMTGESCIIHHAVIPFLFVFLFLFFVGNLMLEIFATKIFLHRQIHINVYVHVYVWIVKLAFLTYGELYLSLSTYFGGIPSDSTSFSIIPLFFFLVCFYTFLYIFFSSLLWRSFHESVHFFVYVHPEYSRIHCNWNVIAPSFIVL